MLSLLFLQQGETAVIEHNTRPFWIAGQTRDVGVDSETWNQANYKHGW